MIRVHTLHLLASQHADPVYRDAWKAEAGLVREMSRRQGLLVEG